MLTGVTTLTLMSELNLVLDAYRRFRTERDGKQPFRNINYYDEAEKWLMEQGCNIDIYWTGQEGFPIWESESRRVEFYLKYVK